ncbi:MAG: hypothetical protein GXO75_16165 [Calditrichaeota bacterium]|nr:hypothetical protein [Calditrichota bacterium]
MEKLLFDNPSFKSGLNFTVRLGEKWKSKVSVGDIVEIPKTGLAKICKIYCCKIAEIPIEVLENEHDEECRTFDGLLKVLKKVYPILFGFKQEEIKDAIVTCLGFQFYKLI